MRFSLLVLWALGVSAALAGAPWLESRVAYEPLLAKLRAAGGNPSKTIEVKSSADLLRLRSGSRYKFSQKPDGRLVIAPLPADAPRNEYVHPILAAGGPVRTAGGIAVEHHDGAITRITVDQDSRSYCPPLASLRYAVDELSRLGIASSMVAMIDRPPKCEPIPGAPAQPHPPR